MSMMQRKKLLFFSTLLWVTLSFAFTTWAATPYCAFRDVSPNTGNTLKILQQEITLGRADNNDKPIAWEGPLVVKRGDIYACSFGLSIIEPPLTLVADRYLYVPTYSGSDRVLTVLDMKQCRIAWQSPVFYGTYVVKNNHILIKGKKLTLEPSCLPPYDFDAYL